jgi:PAS domain S-box-containing protein
VGIVVPVIVVTVGEPAARLTESDEEVGEKYRLLRAADDAALEPRALLKAVRDSGGRVVDFIYHDINVIAARQQRLRREDLLGHSLIESLPALVPSGVFEKYVHCIDTGEPIVVDDLSYFGRTLDGPELQTHRYEMRGVRVEAEYLSLNWRDVNQRYVALEHLQQAREMLRVSADSMLDPQALLEATRDASGQIVDFLYSEVNKATCDYLGLSREELLGRGVVELMPGLADTMFAEYVRCLETGDPVIRSDFCYDNEILDESRRYDLRVTRATSTSLVLTWRDVTDRFHTAQRIAHSEALLRASIDSMLNPHALMGAVRDPDGRVVDFRYLAINQAACDYLGMAESDLVGHTQFEDTPNMRGSELQRRYAQCLADGQPVVLDDYAFFNEILDDARRYDIRATRAGADLLSLNWSDVTDRFRAAQRLAESERYYRLLAENVGDVVSIHRDGKFEWISPSVEAVLGAPPAYWIGREVREIIPPGYEAGHADRMQRLAANGVIQERSRVQTLDGRLLWVQLTLKILSGDDGHHDGYSASFRVIDDEVAAEQQAEDARRQQARADELYRRSVDSAAVGMCLVAPEGSFLDVNSALCDFFGYDAETLMKKTWQELTADESLEADLRNVADLVAGRIDSYRMTKQYIHADGHRVWGDLSVSCLRTPDGQVEVLIAQVVDITTEVQAREELDQARREKEREDERYRRSIDNAAVGMCMVTPDGHLYDINAAGCRFFGYDAQELNGTRWQEITAPQYREGEQSSWDGILEGRIDSYRIVKHYRHRDGRRIWGDLSVSGIRDGTGKLEHMIALITDITARVEADEQNRILARQLQQETDRVKAELESAAAYMSSIMPDGLQGRVNVSSRYLPSQQLGGDCIDYYWIDEDHLLLKLIDVSGHGIEPALLAVSVHNLMRSGSIAHEVLLSPEAVLTELNRLFAMDQQNDHYFTMWYGIYESSTRTLRYASAGAPPAFALNPTGGGTISVTDLSTPAAPIGMFDDAEFSSLTYSVPPGCRILIYSDGANEIALEDGKQLSVEGLKELTTRLAGSPHWSLDELVSELRGLGSSSVLEDDCSLIQVAFD